MGQLLGYGANISGTSGSYGFLEPKGSYRVYVLPQGSHATASSTGTVITLGSTEAASRLTNGHWVQVGTDPANVRRVSAVVPNVQGNTVTVTAAVTVAANDRVYLIGATQPTVSGSSVTYQPNTTIYVVDESEGATPVANSLLTTDSNGAFQFWPSASGLYDAIIQDSRVTNVGSLVDIEIGVVGTPLLPIQGRTDDIGSAALPWDDITMSGRIISAVTSGSGVTYHRFDTTAGITGGALFQFANNGAMRLYGDSWGGILQSWSLPSLFNPKSSRFGAIGNGTADDGAALQAAINAASYSSSDNVGAVVDIPSGTYITNQQLIIPNKVHVRGNGPFSTRFKAGGSFPTSTALVRIGDGAGSPTFNSLLEGVAIDCNDVAGSIGVMSNQCQEGSGLKNVRVTNFKATGISFSTSGCQNWTLSELGVLHTDSAAVGIDINASAGANKLTAISVNSNNATTSDNPGIRLVSSSAIMDKIHCERHVTGVSVGNACNVVIIGINGSATVDALLSASAPGVAAHDINQNSSTIAVNDIYNGVSFTVNAGGWWMLSNDGGANAKSLFTSANQNNRIVGPTVFGNTLTVGGQFGVTGNATFSGTTTTVGGTLSVSGNILLGGGGTVLTQSGGVLTIPNGSWFGISGTGTAVTSIAPVTSGRLVVLIASAGSQAFNDGAGLHVNGSPMTLAASGNPDSTMFFCAGATWVQIGPQAA